MSPSNPPGTSPESDVTASSSSEDPVPAEVHAVIGLFAGQLANISFPDIDVGVLRRQAEELRAEAKTAARAREALDAALAAYVTRLAAVTETARRIPINTRSRKRSRRWRNRDRPRMLARQRLVSGVVVHRDEAPSCSMIRRLHRPRKIERSLREG